MSKGLEALKCIKNVEVKIGNDLNTITKIFENDTTYDTCFETIEKELKAFEIIRNKKVNTNCIISSWGLGKYNSYQSHINLTEKEFELLREVLLWKEN